MLPQLKHIEQQFIASGQSLCFEKGESLTTKGEACGFILYMPQNAALDCNGLKIEVKAGEYLLLKEYFMNQPIQHTLTTNQAIQAILFRSSTIEKLKNSNHLFHLFFIQKLSQQATSTQATFE